MKKFLFTFFNDYVLRSVELDLKLLSRSIRLPYIKRVRLLIAKYGHIFSYILSRKFILGKSYFKFDKHKFYFNHALGGIGGLQATLVEHVTSMQNFVKQEKPFFVDIGSNVGNLSFWLKYFWPNATVICVEPSSLALDCLHKNMARFRKDVHICGDFMSDRIGKEINFLEDTSSVALSRVHDLGEKSGDLLQRRIESSTVDSLLERHGIQSIDLLKVDTEGHEIEVLLGAKKTLKKTKLLHLELNQEVYDFSEVAKILIESNIKFKILYTRFFGYGANKKQNGDILLQLMPDDVF